MILETLSPPAPLPLFLGQLQASLTLQPGAIPLSREGDMHQK